MIGPKDDYDYEEELSEELEEAEEESREKYRRGDYDEPEVPSNAPNITNTPGDDDKNRNRH